MKQLRRIKLLEDRRKQASTQGFWMKRKRTSKSNKIKRKLKIL